MNLKLPKKILIPALVILVGVVSIFLVSSSQIKVIKKLNASVEQLRNDKEELRAKYLMLSSLDEKNIEQQSALAELAVPSEKNIPFILQAFRDAVSKADFLIKEFKFAPGEVRGKEFSSVKTKKVIEELPLTATLIGPADNLNKLLASLESSFPLFEVKNVNFTKDLGQPNKARLKLELLTFYSPPRTKAEGEEIKLGQLVLNEKENSLLEELKTYSRPELKQVPSRGLQRKGENPFIF